MEVSIIIPCYNSQDTIKECLDSIILDAGNTSHKSEIIVVDDGSTDNTRSIISGYENIHYIYIDNIGPAGARNRGAKTARGDILLFTDSDCIVQPGWIDHLLSPFMQNPHISAVKGTYKTRQKEIVAQFCQLEFLERYRFLERQKFIDFVDTYSAAFKRDVFWEIGGFNESFPYPNNEDVDLSYRMASYNKLMVFNPNAAVIHRHKTKAMEYFKLKFSRAYWRMVVYNKYPEKIIKDSYTPHTLKIQMLLINIIFLFLILSPFYNPALYIASAGIVLFMISSVPFAVTGIKHSLSLFLVSFPMLFIRALSLNLGILASLFPVNLKKMFGFGLLFIDSLTIVISVLVSYMTASFIIHRSLFSELIPIEQYLYAIPAVIILYLIILQSSGLYSLSQNYSGISYLFRIFSSSLILTLSLASLSYLFYMDYSRAILILLFPSVFIFSLSLRMLWFRFSEFLIRSGYGIKRAVIVGINDTSQLLAKKMISYKNLGYRFIGFIASDNGKLKQERVIGSIENLPHIIKTYRINDVFFADPSMSTDMIFHIISKASYDITSFKIITSTFDVLIKPVDIESIANIPLIDLKNQGPSFIYKLLKRFFDLLFALILLTVLIIPLFLIYIMLILSSVDSPIQRTPALGYRERDFDIFSFNTKPLKEKGFIKGNLYSFLKMTFLYKTPVIFNIINGTMSLVGPRPVPKDIPQKYNKWQMIRFDAIPGITGIDRITGNRHHTEEGFNRRVLEYDFYYIRNRSLMLDFAILIKSVIFLLFRVL